MGCFPVLALLVIGFGVGYAMDGQTGALWGGGVGFVVGAVAGLIVMWYMRKVRNH